MDYKGNKRAVVSADVATPSSGKNTLQFKIPNKEQNLASRYLQGKYLLDINSKTKDVRSQEVAPIDPA